MDNILLNTLNSVLQTTYTEIDHGIILHDIPNWDSVNALRLLTMLEKQASIRLPLHQYAQLKTLGDLTSLFEERRHHEN